MRMVMESPCIAVTVNGKVIEVPEGTTLADLLGSEGYDRSRIAVEVDGDICPRACLCLVTYRMSISTRASVTKVASRASANRRKPALNFLPWLLWD